MHPDQRRLRLLAALTGPAVLVLTLGRAPAALADPSDYTITVGVPTTNRDGHTDVGTVTNATAESGVQALFETELRPGTSDETSAPEQRFGSALLRVDLNGDKYTDLVVGVPGADNDPGRVDLFLSSPTGIVAAGAQVLSAPAVAGDQFGSALAITGRADGSGDEDLWIGAPGHTVNGKANAGAVYRFALNAKGVATYVQTITQDDALVPGSAKAGDRFGAVLAGGVKNGVLVGVPDEDIGSAKDAGELVQVRTATTGNALAEGVDWSQNSPGVPGTAEAGDHFGASVAQLGEAVGVPGEDVGKLKDAGSIQTFGYDYDTNRLIVSKSFTQDSPGIPGVAEAGDDFGAALSVGIFSCTETRTVAVGAPGEDIGTVKDAGSVTLITQPWDQVQFGSGSCPARSISQGAGLPGKPQAGANVGAALGLVPGDPDADEDETNQLLTGAPGETIGKAAGAGRAYQGIGPHALSFRLPSGDFAGTRYGSVFPTDQFLP